MAEYTIEDESTKEPQGGETSPVFESIEAQYAYIAEQRDIKQGILKRIWSLVKPTKVEEVELEARERATAVIGDADLTAIANEVDNLMAESPEFQPKSANFVDQYELLRQRPQFLTIQAALNDSNFNTAKSNFKFINGEGADGIREISSEVLTDRLTSLAMVRDVTTFEGIIKQFNTKLLTPKIVSTFPGDLRQEHFDALFTHTIQHASPKQMEIFLNEALELGLVSESDAETYESLCEKSLSEKVGYKLPGVLTGFARLLDQANLYSKEQAQSSEMIRKSILTAFLDGVRGNAYYDAIQFLDTIYQAGLITKKQAKAVLSKKVKINAETNTPNTESGEERVISTILTNYAKDAGSNDVARSIVTILLSLKAGNTRKLKELKEALDSKIAEAASKKAKPDFDSKDHTKTDFED